MNQSSNAIQFVTVGSVVTMESGKLIQSPFPERQVQRGVTRAGMGALLALSACSFWACSEGPQATPSQNAPFETAGEQTPVPADSTVAGPEATTQGVGSPAMMQSEGMNEEVELVSPEPAAPAAESDPEPSAEPVSEGPADVPLDPAQSVPAIGQPGFPEGSAPRLVPMEFVGPITGQPVRFNIYFPPGYDSGTASYPVLYDLHGLTDSRDTNPGPVIGSLEAAMRNQVIGPLIVVFPQGFVEGYWADSRDNARPTETQMMGELLPYVERNFRTLAHRARRGVSGFSMGGFGAFAYATKFPERFSVGIGYDSALDTWQTLVGRRAYIATAAFGDDESYFDQISPWANASRNAAVLIDSVALRGVTGSQYRDFNAAFRDHLAGLGIPYDYVETDCDHYYGCPIEREGQDSWALIQTVFSQPATVSAP